MKRELTIALSAALLLNGATLVMHIDLHEALKASAQTIAGTPDEEIAVRAPGGARNEASGESRSAPPLGESRSAPPSGESRSAPPSGETQSASPSNETSLEAAGGAFERGRAAREIDGDAQLTGAIESTGADESAVHLISGHLDVDGATIVRKSIERASGAAKRCGVGAAVLVTGGDAEIRDSLIDTQADGGAGAFASGAGAISIADTSIETRGDASDGVHASAGGTLEAENLNVVARGASSAAIRADRGGEIKVSGGSFSAAGEDSPAIRAAANVDVSGAALTAGNAEALRVEGPGAVRLDGCRLSGNMPDSAAGGAWTVMLYRSAPGGAGAGEGRFEMSGGALSSGNGGLFYTTNADSALVLSGVEIKAEASDYFLRCTGNRRGWGVSGGNGANCRFTGIAQEMPGDVVWDSISNLSLYLTAGSRLRGAVIQDESCAGGGGAGACELYVGADSQWIVTGDSRVTRLYCAGGIRDVTGETVRIVGADGRVYVDGDSPFTVTVDAYSAECDLSGAEALSGPRREAGAPL